MNCPNCNNPLPPGAAHCPSCGCPVNQNAYNSGGYNQQNGYQQPSQYPGQQYGQGYGSGYPQQPSGNGNNNTLKILLIALIAVVVVGIVAVVAILLGNSKSEDENIGATETIVVADNTQAAPAPASVSEMPSTDGVAGKKRANSARMRDIGFTGDFSDIACYTWLSDADVAGLSKSQLRVLRNTIYARHGRRFKSADLRNYFSQFSWYSPYRDEVSPGELTSTEKHNISLIQKYE